MRFESVVSCNATIRISLALKHFFSKCPSRADKELLKHVPKSLVFWFPQRDTQNTGSIKLEQGIRKFWERWTWASEILHNSCQKLFIFLRSFVSVDCLIRVPIILLHFDTLVFEPMECIEHYFWNAILLFSANKRKWGLLALSVWIIIIVANSHWKPALSSIVIFVPDCDIQRVTVQSK